MSLREREFVEAAHAMGAKSTRIIIRHLIPNSLGTILVFGTLTAATAIIAETSLTYLGYGVKPPDTSLGLLVSQGDRRRRHPAVAVLLPGARSSW